MLDWVASWTEFERALGLLGGTLVAAAAWWRVIKPALAFVGRVVAFLDDWSGEPEKRDQSGALVHKATPGWRARLASMEHELHPNRGHSMKDSLDRQEVVVEEIKAKIDELAAADRADREKASAAHRELHRRIDDLYGPMRSPRTPDAS